MRWNDWRQGFVLRVERQGRAFEVVEGQQDAWGFWGQYAQRWETNTLDIIDAYANPLRDYVDVGAWIGPTVLWASGQYRHVTAVEPDPVAFKQLAQNVALNCSGVTMVHAAVAPTTGTVRLHSREQWGDSMSTMLGDGPGIDVAGVTLDSLVNAETGLTKIDVEGGEAIVFPAAAQFLADLEVPVLLSCHWPWMTAEQTQDVLDAMRFFKVEWLDDTDYPTCLLT